jgi:copper(I)-binding protein
MGILAAVRQKNQRVCGAALLALWLLLAPAPAAESRAGTLSVGGAWSPPTPSVATVGAAYFSITNSGRDTDRLVAITSPIARKVEIHESRTVQGTIQMRAVAWIECPPGVTKIEPGSVHVMLLGLSAPLAAGMQFPLNLQFRDAGTLRVQVQVGVRE